MDRSAPVDEWPLIFVVDDDEDAREALRDVIELEQLRMFDAGNAAELFALPGWDEVAVVLLDRQLPDAAPEELISNIRELAPQTGVIMVTGHGDIAGAVACLRAGARDYILKPINPEALLASVNRELDRQSSAERLARSERQYQALFQSAIDGYLILDDEWRIVEANPAACAILGYESAPLVGKSLQALAGKTSDDEPMRDILSQHVQSSGECELTHATGLPMAAEYRLVKNFTPNRQLFSFSDVTDRKRAEERARQAERLAAVGEAMTALSHESRNALQRGSTCLELLELQLDDQPEAFELVTRARKAQEQLRALYEEVRQWAAPINIARHECNIRGVWREAWDHVKQGRQARTAILREHIECDPVWRVDRALMHHVFRNAFENAVEASPEGGAISLRCSRTSSSGASLLRILIRDEGPGLTPEQQARIFEPFFTTKRTGTGLGMALCQRIVTAHGGAILATSPGGAEIEITLPN
jgi:PAS domain S-box-containing protein